MRDALGSVQSVLVLGGGSEIGLATVRALARERARTVVLGVREPEAFDGADDLRASGVRNVDVVRFDADNSASHASLMADVFERHGDIDLVLLAFGVLGDQERSRGDPAFAAAVARTNYVGAVSAGAAAASRLESQGHGALVALSSVAGERARKSNFVYGSSKAGLDAFFQGLGDALAGSGVHVMVVRPGFVHTKMTAGLDTAPLSTTPESVADVIVGGLRRNARTVWAPPALRVVMLLLRLMPRAVFRRLDI